MQIIRSGFDDNVLSLRAKRGMLDETEMICRLREGDIAAMKMVFDSYYRVLSLYALQFVTTVEDAEDLVQEILVSFWENRGGRAFEGSVRAYLFGAVRNSAASFLRQRGRYLEAALEDYPEPDTPDRYDEDEILVRRRRVEAEIQRLPEKAREVFTAIVLENMRYKQVAERMNISVNTVKTHYVRALRQLRNGMDILTLVIGLCSTLNL